MSETDALIQVRIEALAVGGSMIGTVVAGPQAEQGKKAFVRFALPGELVTASIARSAKSHVEAELVSVIEKAETRIAAPCPYFGECGGCQLQHMPIEVERGLKVDMVRSLLSVRGLEPEREITQLAPDLPDYQYRNRVTLHLAPPAAIGFYRQGTGDVVPIDRCLISSDAINAALQSLYSISEVLCSRVPSLILEEAADCVVAIAKMKEGSSRADIAAVKSALGSVYQSYEIRKSRKILFQKRGENSSEQKAHGHFSQVNSVANEYLVQAVCRHISAGPVDDLYAGSGNFSFPLARKGCSVRAVEFDARLVEAGRRQAAQLDVSEAVEFIQSSCERFAKYTALESTVLLDPPRAGAKEVVKRLDPAITHTIVYVSCNIATFARDAAVLQEKGYRLVETKLVDMFPQTHHVETISLFQIEQA